MNCVGGAAVDSRKLIKFGKNSYVVSLPKEWVETNRLEKGAELFVEQKPGSVVISASRTGEKERVAKVSVDGKGQRELEIELTSRYKAGYTTLILEGKDLQVHIAAIKSFILNLAGAEIVEQSLNRIVVKDLIDIRQIALPTLISRIDMMVRSMFQDALAKEPVPGTVLRDRDKDVNRIQFLVARVTRNVLENPAIGNALDVSAVQAYYFDKVAWALERIGDYVKRINDELDGRSKARQERIKGNLREAYGLYLQTMKAYYAKDDVRAVKIHEEILNHIGAQSNLIQRVKDHSELRGIANVRNVLRDLRMILRATIEGNEAKP